MIEWWGWLIIGVIALLSILLGIILVYCSRQKRTVTKKVQRVRITVIKKRNPTQMVHDQGYAVAFEKERNY